MKREDMKREGSKWAAGVLRGWSGMCEGANGGGGEWAKGRWVCLVKKRGARRGVSGDWEMLEGFLGGSGGFVLIGRQGGTKARRHEGEGRVLRGWSTAGRSRTEEGGSGSGQTDFRAVRWASGRVTFRNICNMAGDGCDRGGGTGGARRARIGRRGQERCMNSPQYWFP